LTISKECLRKMTRIFWNSIGLLLIGLICAAFSRVEEAIVIRAGHFPNITHSQAVIGHGWTRQEKGWFERFLGPGVKVEWYIYSAGPSAMEALFANSIDLVYVGPSPTINAYVRSKGEEVRVICGACFGGSALVIQPGSIKQVSDFKNKIVATPQLGNTQDIAARAWFRSQGFHFNLFGGDIRIMPMEGADQFSLFKQGNLEASWTVEPWVSRLVLEAKGKVYLEEAKLWPETDGKYTTTHLVCRRAFLEEYPQLIKKWILAHIELTEWIQGHSQEAQVIFNQEIQKEVRQPLSMPVLQRAWKQLEVTYNPLPVSIWRYAKLAYELGFFKQKPELSRLYELKFLHEVLEERQGGDERESVE
jgi:NitT/TauT family transport system substrate-binding protein